MYELSTLQKFIFLTFLNIFTEMQETYLKVNQFSHTDPDSLVSFYQLNNFLFLFSSPRHVHFKLQNTWYLL